ncbi:MAG: hypothetical protein MI921_10380 [Cytophagales bacterium]|nr:hypothetical protein [Cytophagales bacterium]
MNKNNIEKLLFSSRLTLLTIALTFTFFACNDDDQPEQNLEEVETATLLSLRTEGADGRIYYMAVYEEIPNEPDLSTMVELGPGFRVYAFGENPYTWDGNASNLTKWNVDRTNLNVSEAEVMSLAGLGISGDLGPPAFFSDEQAYFFDLPEGKVVEFNPTIMEITETIDVEPLIYEGVPTSPPTANYDVWEKWVRSGKIIMSVGYSDRQEFTIPNKATTAVFDPAAKTITYHQDTRMASASSTLEEDENGNLYQKSAWEAAFAAHYGDHEPSGLNALVGLLKVNSDGTHDPNFFIDFSEVLNTKAFSGGGIPFVFNNQAVVTFKAPSYEFPDNFADRNLVGGDTAVVLNLTTLETTPFPYLSDDYTGFGLRTIIDGTPYLWADNAVEGYNFILRQDAIDSYTEISKMTGGELQQFYKLW